MGVRLKFKIYIPCPFIDQQPDNSENKEKIAKYLYFQIVDKNYVHHIPAVEKK